MCHRRKLDGPEALVEEAGRAGLDAQRFRIDLESNATLEAFAQDLEEARTIPPRRAPGGRARRNRTPRPAESGSRSPRCASRRTATASAGSAATASVRRLEGRGDSGRRKLPASGCASRRDGGAAALDSSATAELEAVCDLPGPRAGAEVWRLASEWRARRVPVLFGELWERPADRPARRDRERVELGAHPRRTATLRPRVRAPGPARQRLRSRQRPASALAPSPRGARGSRRGRGAPTGRPPPACPAAAAATPAHDAAPLDGAATPPPARFSAQRPRRSRAEPSPRGRAGRSVPRRVTTAVALKRVRPGLPGQRPGAQHEPACGHPRGGRRPGRPLPAGARPRVEVEPRGSGRADLLLAPATTRPALGVEAERRHQELAVRGVAPHVGVVGHDRLAAGPGRRPRARGSGAVPSPARIGAGRFSHGPSSEGERPPRSRSCSAAAAATRRVEEVERAARRSSAGASTMPRSHGASARNSSCGGAGQRQPARRQRRGDDRRGLSPGCCRRASIRASRRRARRSPGAGRSRRWGCTASALVAVRAAHAGRRRDRDAAPAAARLRRVVGEHAPRRGAPARAPRSRRPPSAAGARAPSRPGASARGRSSAGSGRRAASRPRSRSRTSRRRPAGATGRDGRRRSPGSPAAARRAQAPASTAASSATARYEAA